jgi:hypothetical protein
MITSNETITTLSSNLFIHTINYQKILDIANGNRAFIRQYNDLARKLFTSLPKDYAEALRAYDSEKLRKLAHNSRATIELLEIKALGVEIENGKILLKNKANESVLNISINEVKIICDQMLSFFADKF